MHQPTPAPRAAPSRREFLLTAGTALLAGPALAGWPWSRAAAAPKIRSCGPASSYVTKVRAAFVRRRGEYGMRWPGAVYDGAAALRDITARIGEAARDLGIEIDLRPEPLFSPAEAKAWVDESAAAKPDGLLVVLLDRQEHAWPTAKLAADTGLPTVVFAPVGAAFTTNTTGLADRDGVLVCSTSDFTEPLWGLRSIRAAAKLREMRWLVIRGDARRDAELAPFGTRLRTIPAAAFLEEYRATPTDDGIRAMARDYLRRATRLRDATEDDLLNGIKSYVVAGRLLEREQCDGITMDCLGALGKTDVSLPCIAWSRMNDDCIPAACEADLGACVTHAVSQYLLERPGFQQDPVPETARGCLIGAHCSCPTRLAGFDAPPVPFSIRHHHGNRDAVPHPVWRAGERMTCFDVLLPTERLPGEAEAPTTARMVISAGTVVENVAVPPAGGCVVSVMAKLDGDRDLLAYPGFHQLFVQGDWKRRLVDFCRLARIRPVLA